MIRRKRDRQTGEPKFKRVSREEFRESGDPVVYNHILSRMYFEDWHGGVIPFVYREAAKFKSTVSPGTAVEFATNLFARNRGSDESLESAVSEFLTEAVQLMILDGTAIYEICDVEGSEELKSLHSVLARSVRFEADGVIQTVPASSFRNGETIKLSPNRVFALEPPGWIEGGQGFPLTISNLIRENKRDYAPMNHFQANSEGRNSFFDYAAFRRDQELRILNLTKNSGWQGRASYESRVTEYYYVVRFLRFVHGSLRLRDYVLDKINTVLFPRLRELGVTIDRLVVSDLPKPEDILELQAKMERGELGFKEALDRSRRYS